MKKRCRLSTQILQIKLLIIFLLFSSGLQSQTPGGIGDENIKLWLRADKISAANASALTKWTNTMGVANYTVSAYGGSKMFYNSSPNYLVNFNPSVWFNHSGGLSNGTRLFSNTSAFTIITVGKETATSKTTYRGLAGFGYNGNYPAIDLASIKSGAGYRGCWGPYFDFSGGQWLGSKSITYNGIWPGSGQQAQIYSVLSENASGGSNVFTFVDNYKENTGRRTNQTDQFGNGTFVGSSYDAHWTGAVNEVLVFDKVLTDEEIQKVNTYLAIKYGITLRGQTGANATAAGISNYIASDGTVIWNITRNNTFNNNIAGIGRDDASDLVQKQSRSGNNNSNKTDPMKDGNMLAIGLNSVAVSNADNSGTFANDKQFLVWGDNGRSGLQTTDMPSASTLFGIEDRVIQRLQKVWFVQNTGGVTNSLQLKFYLANTGMAGTSPEEFKLLINTTSSFASSSNFIEASVYDAATKTLTFDNVVLNDGDYFTLATKAVYGPGGVIGRLSAWYRGDDPAITNANNSAITGWHEFNGGVNLGNGSGDKFYHSTTTDKLINFNPSVHFPDRDGSGLVSPNNAYFESGGFHLLTVGRSEYLTPTTSTGRAYYATAGVGSDGDALALDLQRDGTSHNGFNPWVEGSSPISYSNSRAIMYNGYQGSGFAFGRIPQIYGGSSANVTGNNEMNYYIDGYIDKNTGMESSPTSTSNIRKFGYKMFVGSSGVDADWQGTVNEVILFNRKLSGLELMKVNSYLALKYGTTLRDTTEAPITIATDISSFPYTDDTNPSYAAFKGSDYYGSDGTKVWDVTKNTGYAFNIAGIFRDDASAVDQKQSRSQNNITNAYGTNNNIAIDGFFKGDMLTVGLGEIVATNAANTGIFQHDCDYTIWGDDGLNPNTILTNLPKEFANCEGARLGRQWKVQVTGTAYDNLTLQFDLNNVQGDIATTYDEMKVLVDEDGDGDFTTGSIRSHNVSSFTGNIATANNVLLQDGEVFTLLTKDFQTGIAYLVPAGSIVSTNMLKCSTGDGWKYIYESDVATPLDANGYGPNNHKVFAINPNGNFDQFGIAMDDRSIFPVTIDANTQLSASDEKAMTVLARRLVYVYDITDSDPYSVNGGLKVRIYFDPQELATADETVSNFALGLGNTANFINSWFKAEGNIAAVAAAVKPTGFQSTLPVQLLTPDSTGVENGVNFVEFWNIDSLSTFGYMAKATIKLNISGKVWVDPNGDVEQNDAYFPIPTGLYIALLDKSQAGNPVLAYTSVNADGTFALTKVLDHEIEYDVLVTAETPVIGDPLSPYESLPSYYVATGVAPGVNAIVKRVYKAAFTTASSDLTDYYFGIEQRPTTDEHEYLNVNQGLFTETDVDGYRGIPMSTLPLQSLSGTDPEDCASCSIGRTYLIELIHPDTKLFYNGKEIKEGDTIFNFQPANMIIYGKTGVSQMGFYYKHLDNALVGSPEGALYEIRTSTPLPITLVTYKAQVVSCNKVLVKWEIADAKDFSHFEIQRSTNGRDFTTITSIGYNDKQSNYDYTDLNLANGNYQYRIKMIDLNGSYKLSPVEKITIDCNANEIVVFPTITSNNISVKGLEGSATVRIYAVNGQLVFEKTNVNNFDKLNISHLASGTYSVQIIQNKKLIKTTPIIKHN